MILARRVCLCVLVWAGAWSSAHAQVIATRPPQINITSPASGFSYDAGTSSSVTLSGTGANITTCTWTNSLGGSGSATLALSGSTLTWTAGTVALTVGANQVTLTCGNGAGSTAIRGITITRSASGGLSCADVTTRCVPSEHATIDACADAANAGDTCLIAAGTYLEIISPAHNGSSGAGNTITFVAESGATVNVCGMDTSSNSYLRFVHINFNEGAGCSNRLRIVTLNGTNTGIEFWYVTVTNGGDGIGMVSLADRCNQCVILADRFTALNAGDTVPGIYIQGTNNFICYNEFDHLDADSIDGSYTNSRVCNNYTHDIDLSSGAHADFFQMDSHDLGLSGNVIEANWHKGEGNGTDEHVGIIQNQSPGQCQTSCGPVTENLWRRNAFFNNSTGIGISFGSVATMTYNRLSFNTLVDLQRNETSTYCTNLRVGVNNTYVYNNLAYECWSTGFSSGIEVFHIEEGTFDYDYNFAFDKDGSVTFASSWNNQAHEISNVDPLFVNKAARDFHLQSGSGARDVGGPYCLTSGSGTGTTFNVATGCGGWIKGDNTNLSQYSGGLVRGDIITVGGDTVEVASVSTDAITVTSSFTWANAEGVADGTDLTPDVGFAPYKSSYTLTATYVDSGGTVTTTPSDASLVRFVVCRSDTVPYAVDNTSPYTCPSATGTLSVHVFPMYATETPLWVVATP